MHIIYVLFDLKHLVFIDKIRTANIIIISIISSLCEENSRTKAPFEQTNYYLFVSKKTVSKSFISLILSIRKINIKLCFFFNSKTHLPSIFYISSNKSQFCINFMFLFLEKN